MEMTDPYHADAVASYECLWQFRRRVVSWWPPPDRDDSIRLAVTEAAEALDAWLRLHRPQYARNHDRLNGGEEAILFELTDCAMMLLTALGGDEDNAPEEIASWNVVATVDKIVYHVTGLLEFQGYNALNSDLSWHFRLIQSYPGMYPLLPRLQARLARIEAMRGPAAECHQ